MWSISCVSWTLQVEFSEACRVVALSIAGKVWRSAEINGRIQRGGEQRQSSDPCRLDAALLLLALYSLLLTLHSHRSCGRRQACNQLHCWRKARAQQCRSSLTRATSA